MMMMTALETMKALVLDYDEFSTKRRTENDTQKKVKFKKEESL